MDIKKLQYRLEDSYSPLEEWMIFAIKLGEITRSHKEFLFNIYISLPNNLLFSYFFILGFINSNLSEMISDDVILEKFKKINPGDIVYYFDNGDWKKCSVIELRHGLTNENSWHLKILNNKKIDQFIPSSKWRNSIVLTNQNNETFLNARKVKDFQSISLGNLKHIYSLEQLQTHELINEPCLFISGNRNEFSNYLSTIYLNFNNELKLTFKDFVYDGNDVKYKNIEWLSKSILDKYDINKVSTILFLSANKALSHMNSFKNSSRIILDDRHDNTETSELLRLSIEQEILSNQSINVTKDLNNLLKINNINVPQGVEILVWK